MSVIRTYWALDVKASKEFEQVVIECNEKRFAIMDSLKEAIGSDDVNITNQGQLLLTYKQEQSLPFLTKKPAFINQDGYHYFTKGKSEQSTTYAAHSKQMRELVTLEKYTQDKWPKAYVDVMGDSSGGRWALHRSVFWFTKGQLIYNLPILTDKPNYSSVPEGFVELTGTQFAELTKDTDDE